MFINIKQINIEKLIKYFSSFFFMGFIILGAVFLNGCSGSDAPEYNFQPELSDWIMKTYKGHIADYGIKEIKSYSTTYRSEGTSHPYKKIPEYYAYFNKDGNNLEEIFYFNSNNYYDKKYTYSYNKSNKRNGQELFYIPGEGKQNVLHTFDTSGNLIEQIKFDKSHKVDSKTVYKYNYQNKLIERVNFKGKNETEDKFTYEYDVNGNLVRINYYNPVYILNAFKVFKYDSNNNLVFEGAYSANKIEQFRFEYKYDKDNLIDSADFYSPLSGLIKYWFKKDDEGKMILIQGRDKSGQLYKNFDFDYTYHYSMDRFTVNSTLTPISRAEYEGSLIAGYIQSSSFYFPVKRFRSDNISCEMTWYDKVNGMKSVKGKALISAKEKKEKYISSSIIMDYSGSMDGNDRKNIQSAADIFVTKMSDNDEAMITKFDVDLYNKTDFTNDKYSLSSAINNKYDFENLKGATALYDAINYGVGTFNNIDFRKSIRCVVVLTDGGENASYNKDREYLINNARENGIPIYTIGYGIDDAGDVNNITCKGHYDPPNKNKNFCEWDLWDIANRTGGFYFYSPRNSGDIADVYNSISGQLGSTFDVLLEFPPDELPASGTPVTVKIIVTFRKNVQVIERNFIIK